MSILAVIPARGGSKGIPRKNLVILRNAPLISHTIRCAKRVPEITRIFVSTDDEEIAAVARSEGAEVPALRPLDIAQDQTPMIAVLQHALEVFGGSSPGIEAIVLLQPTSPLRHPHSVSQGISVFREKSAASVVSVVRVPHSHTPGSLLSLLPDQKVVDAFPSSSHATRRQDKPGFYARNGPAVLVLSPGTICNGVLYPENTRGFEMSKIQSHDIDEFEDIAVADALWPLVFPQ